MISVCTCSHSIEEHGIAGSGGRCQVCECDCFRGAKRIPRSCRYRLRASAPRIMDMPGVAALVLGGIDNTMRDLFAEEKAS